MSSWRKKLPSACTICKRNTNYSCITCGKSVCVRVECSIAEEKEDTLGWEASRSVGYCLPRAEAAAGAGQNEFCSENRYPSNDIEPAALENESFCLHSTTNNNTASLNQISLFWECPARTNPNTI